MNGWKISNAIMGVAAVAFVVLVCFVVVQAVPEERDEQAPPSPTISISPTPSSIAPKE